MDWIYEPHTEDACLGSYRRSGGAVMHKISDTIEDGCRGKDKIRSPDRLNATIGKDKIICCHAHNSVFLV